MSNERIEKSEILLLLIFLSLMLGISKPGLAYKISKPSQKKRR